MVIHIPFHPAFIAAAGVVVIFVLIKSALEAIPL